MWIDDTIVLDSNNYNIFILKAEILLSLNDNDRAMKMTILAKKMMVQKELNCISIESLINRINSY